MVRVWDPATGQPVGEPLAGHTEAVAAVAWGELGGRPVLASAGWDGTVRVWERMNTLLTLRFPERLTDIAISLDGVVAVAGAAGFGLIKPRGLQPIHGRAP
jgi:WD40 repeat protein